MERKKDTVPHEAVRDARLQIEDLFEAEKRVRTVEVDFRAGWMAYREELAETRALLLPEWALLPDEVMEAWCHGVRVAGFGDPLQPESFNQERHVS